MFDSQIRAIWLFFYLVTLDESLAFIEASKATDIFFQIMRKKPQTLPNVAVIQATEQISNKLNYEKLNPNFPLAENGINLSFWKEMRNRISRKRFFTLIWSQILKFSYQEIAQATGITPGSACYRVEESVRILSQILPESHFIEVKV